MPGLIRAWLLPLALQLGLMAARADASPAVDPLRPSPGFTQIGPDWARGAIVWLHGAHDSRIAPPPPEPPWVARMAGRALDVWRFDRPGGQDSLAAGAEGLARGLAGLRRIGYRHIVVAGFSRGGWIALTAAQRPGLADAIVALSPAAHGTRPERWEQAMAEWTSLWQGVRAPETRIALVQVAGDPYDQDPDRRLQVVGTARSRIGFPLLSLFQPTPLWGHTDTLSPLFDPLFGASLADFADPAAAAVPLSP
jgi:alpha-beta hydrolase superfamily lysophospholipase